MFSETIYISHGANGSVGGVDGGGQVGQVVSNGDGCHQNGSSEVLYKESYGSNSDNVRSYYKSRVIEKLYSDGARATREESREVSCFVRSEIKWVFLKSLKVRQQKPGGSPVLILKLPRNIKSTTMERLNKFCKIKTIILEIFGKIFGQTGEAVEYKYINTRQTEL